MTNNETFDDICSLSVLRGGDIFAYDHELYLKVESSDYCNMYAVAIRNGALVPFSFDPMVVYKDVEIRGRRRRKNELLSLYRR